MRRWSYIDLMLAYHLRRRVSIESTLGQLIVFAGYNEKQLMESQEAETATLQVFITFWRLNCMLFTMQNQNWMTWVAGHHGAKWACFSFIGVFNSASIYLADKGIFCTYTKNSTEQHHDGKLSLLVAQSSLCALFLFIIPPIIVTCESCRQVSQVVDRLQKIRYVMIKLVNTHVHGQFFFFKFEYLATFWMYMY